AHYVPSAFIFLFPSSRPPRALHSFPTRRSSDLTPHDTPAHFSAPAVGPRSCPADGSRDRRRDRQPSGRSDRGVRAAGPDGWRSRSEEHTSELQSLAYLVCRLLLEKKKETAHGDA